jgi:electron transport complex protein RnfC
MQAKLYNFHGGMHLDGHKAESLSGGLRTASLPEQLILPLRQHIGEYNKPLVEVGNRVLKGDVIAANSSLICAAVHAPTSGVVSAIGNYPVPHPSGQQDSCIVIDVDDEDEAAMADVIDPQTLEPDELIQRICRAGIVGLGGAAFPTSPKLSRGKLHNVDSLIINGVECEPYITCDDMLMRHYAAEVIRGSGYLQQILEPQTTLIAIEDNKPEAIAAMQRALADHPLANTEIIAIPTIYPSGGEKQLIQILTGKEVPHGELAFDIGLLCQNVGTCVAITRALEHDQPLISRIVTCTGDNIEHPGNWEVRFGTPISHLIEQAGGYKSFQSSRPATASWSCARKQYRMHPAIMTSAFAAANAPRFARHDYCRNNSTGTRAPKPMTAPRNSTCSTASSAVAAPRFARARFRWCSTIAPPKAKYARRIRRSSNPIGRGSVSSSVKSGCC